MESSVLPGVSAKGHILFGIKAKSHVLYGDCLELVQNGRALSGVSAKSNVLFGGSGNPEPLVTGPIVPRPLKNVGQTRQREQCGASAAQIRQDRALRERA